MKTLLRDPSTGQYFEALERWTPNRDQAYDFGPISRAVKFAHKAHFADMELVLAFETTEPEPALPFQKLVCNGHRGSRVRTLGHSSRARRP
jgi:hypothetical protein